MTLTPTRGRHQAPRGAADPVAVERFIGRLTAGVIAILLLVAPWKTSVVAPGMMAVAVLGVLLALSRRNVSTPPLMLLCALVPIGQTVSLLNSPDVPWALRLVVLSWAGIGCVLAITQLDDEANGIVMAALIVSAVLVCAVSLSGAGQMSSHEGGGVINGRLQGPFAQPNELGSFAQLTLPILLALAAATRDRRIRVLAAVGALPVAGALVLSLSRGGWLGIIVSFALLMWIAPRLRKPLVGVLVALIVLGAVSLVVGGPAGAIVGDRLGSIFDSSENVTDQRPAIWQFALQMVGEHPVIGVGPGGLATSSLTPESSRVAFVQPLHAHDLFLTTLAEGGLMGGLILAALLGAGALIASRLARQLRGGAEMRGAWIPLGITTAIAGAVAHGIIDFPWRAPALTFLTWALVGGLVRSTVNERFLMTHADPSSTATQAEAVGTRRGSSSDFSEEYPANSRRGMKLPIVLGLIGTLLVGLAVLLMPRHYESTSVIGLRPIATSAKSSGAQVAQNPLTADDLKQLASQYAVSAGAKEEVENVRRQAGLPSSSSATAAVDPESTTMRITAKGDSRQDAATLSSKLSDTLVSNVKKDGLAQATVLEQATPAYAQATPNKLLYALVGELVVLALCAGLWLLRRRF